MTDIFFVSETLINNTKTMSLHSIEYHFPRWEVIFHGTERHEKFQVIKKVQYSIVLSHITLCIQKAVSKINED